jgi:Zn-finger nucleic acid-binding protein
MKCPNCSGSLVEKDLGQVPVDICQGCGGTWFDRTEMERYAKSVSSEGRISPPDEGAFRAYTAEGIATCPKCDSKTLQHVTFDVLESLRCSECLGVYVSTHQIRRFEIAAGVRPNVEETCWRILDLIVLFAGNP